MLRKKVRRPKDMSVIDEVLKANQEYAKNFKLGHLPMPPANKLAVVTCMDARMTVSQLLGLKTGEAHIIRNAGGILTFKDEELRKKLQKTTGTAAVAPMHFHAFSSLEENVREQIQKVKSHPWVPKHIPVRGFIYDVKTGRLNEVSL